MNKRVAAVGICWFRADDYDEILRLMTDRDVLPDTFDEWRQAAETGEQRLRAGGMVVARVDCEAREFAAWCAARNVKPDSKARMAFANEGAARKLANEE